MGNKKTKTRMPKREMLQWLKSRQTWNHQDWLGLLDDLRDKGFTEWTDCEEGQAQLGLYLESNRK